MANKIAKDVAEKGRYEIRHPYYLSLSPNEQGTFRKKKSSYLMQNQTATHTQAEEHAARYMQSRPKRISTPPEHISNVVALHRERSSIENGDTKLAQEEVMPVGPREVADTPKKSNRPSNRNIALDASQIFNKLEQSKFLIFKIIFYICIIPISAASTGRFFNESGVFDLLPYQNWFSLAFVAILDWFAIVLITTLFKAMLSTDLKWIPIRTMVFGFVGLAVIVLNIMITYTMYQSKVDATKQVSASATDDKNEQRETLREMSEAYAKYLEAKWPKEKDRNSCENNSITCGPSFETQARPFQKIYEEKRATYETLRKEAKADLREFSSKSEQNSNQIVMIKLSFYSGIWLVILVCTFMHLAIKHDRAEIVG